MKPRTDIAAILLGFCNAYEKQMTEALLQIWNTVLEELTSEELASASKAYLKSPECPFFPKPGQIYLLARPNHTEADSQLISERIWIALTRYGPDSLGEQRAKNFIASDVGWALIENQGGWYSFYKNNNVDIDSAPTLKSQWRKSISSLEHKKQRGESLVKQLPDQQLIKLSDLFKGSELSGK